MTERSMRIVMALDGAQNEVRVIGEFDRLQVDRFDRLAAGVTSDVQRLVVDLSGATIIDSAALGSLVRLRHALDEVEASLSVVVSLPFQEKLMRIGGLFDYLGVEVRSQDD